MHKLLALLMLAACGSWSIPAVEWPAFLRGGAGVKAGVAVTEITPPTGWRLSGYAGERFSTGIQGPLQAKALILQQQEFTAALVVCDLNGISPELSSRVRQQAGARAGLPPENILILAAHTSASPLYYGPLREQLHRTAIAAQGRDDREQIDYPAILGDRLVEVILRARRSAQAVQLDAGILAVPQMIFRPHPAMPADPELFGLVLMRRDRNQALASLACFPLAPSSAGGMAFHAGYPQFFERGLRQVIGTNFTSLLAAGACARLANAPGNSPTTPDGATAEAERVGYALARSMVGAFSTFQTITKPALALRWIQVPIGSPEQPIAAVAKDGEDTPKPIPAGVSAEVLAAVDRPLSAIDEVPGTRTELCALRLGPEAVLIGMPGRYLARVSTALKKESPFTYTGFFELCTDAESTKPNAENERALAAAAERLAQSTANLLRELREKP